MRLLIVVYDQGIDETLMDHIQDLELPGWTKTQNAHGIGGAGYKLGDSIWPGQNNMLYIQIPDERTEEVVQAIKEVQNSYRLKPGITIWSLPVEEL
jgi:hypothetical protein